METDRWAHTECSQFALAPEKRSTATRTMYLHRAFDSIGVSRRDADLR